MAVLVAIAIPIFTAQLEKSREATDAANLRAAYAELASAAVLGEAIDAKTEGNITINAAAKDAATYSAVVKLNQTQADWQNASIKGSKIGSADAGTPTAGGKGTITLTAATGAAEIAYAAN